MTGKQPLLHDIYLLQMPLTKAHSYGKFKKKQEGILYDMVELVDADRYFGGYFLVLLSPFWQ